MKWNLNLIFDVFRILGAKRTDFDNIVQNDFSISGFVWTKYGQIYFESPWSEPYNLYLEFDDILNRAEVGRIMLEETQFDVFSSITKEKTYLLILSLNAK